MGQNIYDDEIFYKGYYELRNLKKGVNANDLIEIPNFRKLVPNVTGKRILDLGCGYGENSKCFKELGASYVLGIDISNHMIDEAVNKNSAQGVCYKVMSMEDISDINEKFDIVISSLAFHYVENFKKLIRDINNLLVDGGTLIFSQEHPITICIKYTENVKKGHIVLDNKYFGLFSDYNVPGIREKNWLGKDVIKYHRNFEEIINTLIECGFRIEKISEPKPTEEIISKNPKYINQYDRPFFLFVKVVKIGR